MVKVEPQKELNGSLILPLKSKVTSNECTLHNCYILHFNCSPNDVINPEFISFF